MSKKETYPCDNCGKPSKYNLQNVWRLYELIKSKSFPCFRYDELDEWEGDSNEFLCEDCAKEKGII